MKYYAVRQGRRKGIFVTWEDCLEVIKGYSGAEYRSFRVKGDAEKWLQGEDFEADSCDESAIDLSGLTIFCSGKYDTGSNRWGYGIVIVQDGVFLGEFKGSGVENRELSGRNIRASIEGVLAALNYCLVNGLGSVRLYVDYEGLFKWYTGEWGCKSLLARYYREKMGLYGGINKEFLVIGGKSKNVNYLRAVQAAKASLGQ